MKDSDHLERLWVGMTLTSRLLFHLSTSEISNLGSKMESNLNILGGQCFPYHLSKQSSRQDTVSWSEQWRRWWWMVDGEADGDNSPPHLPLSSYLLPPLPVYNRPAIPATRNLNINFDIPANNNNYRIFIFFTINTGSWWNLFLILEVLKTFSTSVECFGEKMMDQKHFHFSDIITHISSSQ